MDIVLCDGGGGGCLIYGVFDSNENINGWLPGPRIFIGNKNGDVC